jgi:hypothetical protein
MARLRGLLGNTIDSPLVNRIFKRPEPIPEPEFPTLEWGGESNFIIPPQSQFPSDSPTGSVTIIWPEDRDQSEQTEEDLQRTLTEVSRETSNVRVENPSDASQFVVVERIDKMTMTDSFSGETIVLAFNNPAG